MKREAVLAVWEQAHGRLHDNQRRAFLKKEYLKELLRFPDDVIVRAARKGHWPRSRKGTIS